MIPSQNGDDSQTSGSPQGRGSGPCGNLGVVAQCPGGSGPSGLPRRAVPHGAVRAAVAGSDPPARCAGAGAPVTSTWRDGEQVDQGSGQSQRSVPLRGQERSGLPDQVEALPRRPEGLQQALDAMFERFKARPSPVFDWLLARAFDGTHVGGDWKGWPLCWWRSALVSLAAKLIRINLTVRVLWITCVHKLGTTYTLSPVDHDRGGE